ncbi:hypothetical protein PHLGIDRAFT_499149 [Phlebiopsis gigantea 11061_1 CR5-6]|uniref:Uncharacterized protein n=1 Tax=Phlebiopsis gigantea (strain 11061_1 CR5-6) TaxID=745531 RepID=A0A0C3SE43_PHLG1|nr:hypothetical protein PHLGIDRAFT_499149 [Phlebiopsis gigantea 11061_1 CR5-6]
MYRDRSQLRKRDCKRDFVDSPTSSRTYYFQDLSNLELDRYGGLLGTIERKTLYRAKMVQDATYRRYIYVRHLSSDELWAFDAECYEFWHRAWDLELVRRMGLWRPPRGGPSREEEPYQVRDGSKDSREFKADGVGSVVTKAHVSTLDGAVFRCLMKNDLHSLETKKQEQKGSLFDWPEWKACDDEAPHVARKCAP